MIQALAIVRGPLDNFYNSLNDEQRQHFATLAPTSAARSNRRGFASDNDLAALCSRRAEGFTQLPAQRVEKIVNHLQASCPTQLPQTALDRFDAVAKRVNAMGEANKDSTARARQLL